MVPKQITINRAIQLVLEVSQIEWYQNRYIPNEIDVIVLEVSQIEWYQNEKNVIRSI